MQLYNIIQNRKHQISETILNTKMQKGKYTNQYKMYIKYEIIHNPSLKINIHKTYQQHTNIIN